MLSLPLPAPYLAALPLPLPLSVAPSRERESSFRARTKVRSRILAEGEARSSTQILPISLFSPFYPPPLISFVSVVHDARTCTRREAPPGMHYSPSLSLRIKFVITRDVGQNISCQTFLVPACGGSTFRYSVNICLALAGYATIKQQTFAGER